MPDLRERRVDGTATTEDTHIAGSLQAPGAPLSPSQQGKGDGQGAEHSHEAAVLAQCGHKEAQGEEGPPGHDQGLAYSEAPMEALG